MSGSGQPNEFMNTAELAAWLGVPEYTVTREAREGRLPGRKIGKGWRFSRTAILDHFRGADAERPELPIVHTVPPAEAHPSEQPLQ